MVFVCLQQRYGYQEEVQRSLNSLHDDPTFPFLGAAPRSRSRGHAVDRDRQLLQNLVSYYLPSSSSSSSQHRGAVASSLSSSSSSIFPEVDFPLDYGEDYVYQVAQLSKQQQAERKTGSDAVAAPDGETQHKYICQRIVNIL